VFKLRCSPEISRGPSERRRGALQKHQYRELDIPDNPDAEPPCRSTKPAIIVFGKHPGRTLSVCTEPKCPVHNPQEAPESPPSHPRPSHPLLNRRRRNRPAAEGGVRIAKSRILCRTAAQGRRTASGVRAAATEVRGEVASREAAHKARLDTLERIVASAPAVLTAAQLRTFLRFLLNLSPTASLNMLLLTLCAMTRSMTRPVMKFSWRRSTATPTTNSPFRSSSRCYRSLRPAVGICIDADGHRTSELCRGGRCDEKLLYSRGEQDVVTPTYSAHIGSGAPFSESDASRSPARGSPAANWIAGGTDHRARDS
jgi:hypothetical protein